MKVGDRVLVAVNSYENVDIPKEWTERTFRVQKVFETFEEIYEHLEPNYSMERIYDLWGNFLPICIVFAEPDLTYYDDEEYFEEHPPEPMFIPMSDCRKVE